MAIYYFVLAFLPLALVASIMRSRNAGMLVLLLTAIVATLITSLRWASDVDHLDYADMFSDTPDIANFNQDSIWALHGEPGYLLLSSILKSLGLNFVVLSVACGVFSVCVKAIIASRFSRSAGLAFCLYLCIHFITIEFIQIRWAVASSLIILAVYFQMNRKLLFVAVLLALAVSFHYFSAIFVFVCLLAEVKKYVIFYLVIVAISLIGFVLAINGLVIAEAFASEAYVIKRLFRYLNDPQSNVGLLSYAKLVAFPMIYFAFKKRHPSVDADVVTTFLCRIAFASIAVTLFLSFVPLMHFRAVVVADFFSLLLILRILDQLVDQFKRVAIMTAFSALYSVWFVIDIANYVAAERLYKYTTWL